MFIRSLARVLAVLALTALPATAQLSPTSQTRSVSASSTSAGDLWALPASPEFPNFDPPTTTLTGTTGTDAQSAFDFTDFSTTVSVAAPGVLVVSTAGSASATIDSVIASDGIATSGSLAVATDSYVLDPSIIALANQFLNPPVPYYLGFARDTGTSSIVHEVDFDVSTDTPYTLVGDIAMPAADELSFFVGTHSGSLAVVLSGPGGVLHEIAWDQVTDGCAPIVSCAPFAGTLDESGVLTPGSYSFEVRMTGLARAGCGDVPGAPPCWMPTNGGSFDLTLTAEGDGCGASPASGCEVAGKAALVVNEAAAGKEKLKLSMKGFPSAVSQSDFGDPINGETSQLVCLYDGADALVAELVVDRAGADCGTKPCWKDLGGVGYRYKDTVASASGVNLLLGRGGPAGSGKVIVKGRNNAPKGQTSLPTGIAALLAGANAARAQVVTSDGSCFESTLSNVKRADGTVFKAKTP